MRKLMLNSIFLVILLLTACSGGEPQLSLETTGFDFGGIVNGNIVSRDVTVKNEGDALLVVDTVSTSCGCTTATLEPMTIPAGGDAILHIEFDSGAHGPELTGEVMRRVIIASNDLIQPEAVVEFVANILPAQ